MPTLKARKNSKGFTLIEFLIVVAIIGLIAILVILLLIRNITKANDAKRKADIVKISTALEDYYGDNNCYPDPSVFSECGSEALKPYLDTIPCDPVYKYPYCYFAEDETPTSGCYQKYRALATLKFFKDPDIKSLGCDGTGYCGWETECSADANRYGFNYGVASRNTFVANPSYVPPGPTLPPGLPSPGPSGIFACTPQGSCDAYDDPDAKGCPITFQDKNLCILYCNYPQYRCAQ